MRGNLLPPLHGLLFLISSIGSFYMHHPTERIPHATHSLDNPVVEQWLEWEIAQWVHHEGSIQQSLDYDRMLYRRATSCSMVISKPDMYQEKSQWLISRNWSLNKHGARWSSVVRAFAHGAMGHRIDTSWWTHWAISRSSQCSMTVGWCT